VDFKTVLRFLRPVTLPAPAAGVVGGTIAATGGWPGDGGPLLLALVSALLLTGASNGLNQIADLETDRINRPDRPMPSGRMSRGQAWTIVVLLLLAAVPLALLVNTAYAICVAVTIPVTAAYSFPPLRTKRIPLLANATIATPRGLLLVVAGWAVGGGVERTEAWILGGLAWLYILGAATTKDFADTKGDRATGCMTLPILLGPRRAAMFVAPFLVIPYLMFPVCAVAGWLPTGGLGRWAALGGGLALLGAIAGALLVRSPEPPPDGRPHPSWGLMYVQFTVSHLGVAALYAL